MADQAGRIVGGGSAAPVKRNNWRPLSCSGKRGGYERRCLERGEMRNCMNVRCEAQPRERPVQLGAGCHRPNRRAPVGSHPTAACAAVASVVVEGPRRVPVTLRRSPSAVHPFLPHWLCPGRCHRPPPDGPFTLFTYSPRDGRHRHRPPDLSPVPWRPPRPRRPRSRGCVPRQTTSPALTVAKSPRHGRPPGLASLFALTVRATTAASARTSRL